MSRFSFLAIAALFALAAIPGAAQPPLVGPAWLEQHRQDANLVIIDIRDDASDETPSGYAAGHIPGAIHSSYLEGGWRLERDGIAAQLPALADLEQRLGSVLGVSSDDAIVIVAAGTGADDFAGAARVYWTFKLLGQRRLSILNGGMRAWVASGGELIQGDEQRWPIEFHATPQLRYLASTAEVEEGSTHGLQLVDARAPEYYLGSARLALVRQSGTIPGARNAPSERFFRRDAGDIWRFDPALAAREAQRLGLREAQAIVTFCNTGHFGAVDWFAFSEVLNMPAVSLYAGSMAAWTQDPARPVHNAARQTVLTVAAARSGDRP